MVNVLEGILAIMLTVLIAVVVVSGTAQLKSPLSNFACNTTVAIRNEFSKIFSTNFAASFFRGVVMDKLPFSCTTQELASLNSDDWSIESFSGTVDRKKNVGQTSVEYSLKTEKNTKTGRDEERAYMTLDGETYMLNQENPFQIGGKDDLILSFKNYPIGVDTGNVHAVSGESETLSELATDLISCFNKFGKGTADPLDGAPASKPFTCTIRNFDFTNEAGKNVVPTFRHLYDYMKQKTVFGRDETYMESMGDGTLRVCGFTSSCYISPIGTIAGLYSIMNPASTITAEITTKFWRDMGENSVKYAKGGGVANDDSNPPSMWFPIPMTVCIPMLDGEYNNLFFSPDLFDTKFLQNTPVLNWFKDVPIISNIIELGDDVIASRIDAFANPSMFCHYETAKEDILDRTLTKGTILTGFHDGYPGVGGNLASGSWELCGRDYSSNIGRATFAEVIMPGDFHSSGAKDYKISSDGPAICVRDPDESELQTT